MRLFGRVQKLISVAVLAYIGFFYVSPSLANTILAIFLVGMVPVLILRQVFLNQLYKYSIKNVQRHFVLRDNALHNEHVTVIFTPDEKIVVMDNFADKRRAKRMFTLKKNQLNINKAWNRVCRVFDSFVTLDSLVSFYSYDTKVEVVTLDNPTDTKSKTVTINRNNSGQKFVNLGDVKVDSYSSGTNIANDKGVSFVDMNNIQGQKNYVPKPQTTHQEFANLSDLQETEKYVPKDSQATEFSDLGDILSSGSNKIDINYATASEIAILPGINIVGAKKIVEHRDLNGLFKSEDEFFEIAGVKDHFKRKIRAMIVLGKPSVKSDDEDDSEGRIVDF